MHIQRVLAGESVMWPELDEIEEAEIRDQLAAAFGQG
jgi:hypothetical protein